MTFRGVNYSEKKHTAFEIFGYFLKYLGFFPGKCTGFFSSNLPHMTFNANGDIFPV